MRWSVRARLLRLPAPCAAAGLIPALLVTLSASTAHAGAADVKAAYSNLDYETCVAASDTALTQPADRAEREDTYRFRGLCLAALGDTEAAKDAFIRLLALNPEAKLPDGLSPRFTSSFLEAKGDLHSASPTQLTIEGDELLEKTRVLTVKVDDPFGLIATVQWRAPDGELHDELAAAERMEVQVPNEVATALVAFDKGGGIVTELALSPKTVEVDKQIEEKEEPAPAIESDDDGSLLTSPWLWLGVSAVGAAVVVAAAAGAGVGIALYQPQAVSVSGRAVFATDPADE